MNTKIKNLKILFFLYLITVNLILFLFINQLNAPNPVTNHEVGDLIIIDVVKSIESSFLSAGLVIGILINFTISLFLVTTLFHLLFHFTIKKITLSEIILLPLMNTVLGILLFLITTSIFDFNKI